MLGKIYWTTTTIGVGRRQEQRKVDEDRDIETATNLLAELLVKMGKQLGYDFDKVYVKKSCFRKG
jgi:hypothetical protein